MKKIIWLLCFWLISNPGNVQAQGKAYNWLLGYLSVLPDTYVTADKSFLRFDSVSVNVIPANFKMPFRAAQGNISDEQGNLLFVSNGCWIADSTGDTLQGGGGLTPGDFADSWCSNFSGIPIYYSNVFLPYPGDSTLYILIHQTLNDTAKATGLFYTLVDRSLNNNLGGVVPGQKNVHFYTNIMVPSMAVCQHANGRDWWIVGFSANGDSVLKFLLDPSGISFTGSQLFAPTNLQYANGVCTFDPNGERLAFSYYDGIFGAVQYDIYLYDFDRCSGLFSNLNQVNYTDSFPGLCLSFSSNSKFLYTGTARRIRQFDL